MQPRGNALLVGVGGSGRKSLSRLATYVADQKCFSIEISKGYRITEFREDLKTLYRQVQKNLPACSLHPVPHAKAGLDDVLSHTWLVTWLTHMSTALQAGCQNKPTVFLFDETQIVQETFLEDINNILTSGKTCCSLAMTNIWHLTVGSETLTPLHALLKRLAAAQSCSR